MRKYLSILFVFCAVFAVAKASDYPKQEFRGVWLSTVANIDWPENMYDSEAKKQADLVRYMDTFSGKTCLRCHVCIGDRTLVVLV